MPVQNIGLVMQLHRRWMVYQLQQMGRAAMSPLSTAKRAVRLHSWEEHMLDVACDQRCVGNLGFAGAYKLMICAAQSPAGYSTCIFTRNNSLSTA
jgi:hypothetical protein